MTLSGLLKAIRGAGEAPAFIYRDRRFSYGWLHRRFQEWGRRLAAAKIGPGDVVAMIGEHSPDAAALMLALIEKKCVVVPLTRAAMRSHPDLPSLSRARHLIRLGDGEPVFLRRPPCAPHPLLRGLSAAGEAGLIVFSSGSTGAPKAALHGFDKLLAKYRLRRRPERLLIFLLLDHLGGINTLLHTLSSAGLAVVPSMRRPQAVCRAIERHGVTILPTTPTFLNLLILSGAMSRHDLSSLKLITYGTEVMPDSTLARLRENLPGVELRQTYGLTELGVFRVKSKGSDSPWVQVGGEGVQTKVIDGLLHIRSPWAMLGYLNAPDPFGPGGWLNTGDRVIEEGGWLRIMGRDSELINVGGQKVYPAQVESVLQTMPGVEDVAVRKEENALMGNIVLAQVKLRVPETAPAFGRRMRAFCKSRLSPFMVPQKVVLSGKASYDARFKRLRA